jgi:hypothetical protein
LLFSIIVATLLSLGLDTAVGALVTRGWSRARAALFAFASLLTGVALIVPVTINPLWSEIRAFADHLPLHGIAGSAFFSLLFVVTLTFLSLFVLIERPLITNWLFAFTHPQTEARWRPVLDQSISAVAATLVGKRHDLDHRRNGCGPVRVRLRPSFPIVLAVITGLLDLVPQLGATIAGVILVLAGLTINTPTAIAMVAIQLVYQQVENNLPSRE